MSGPIRELALFAGAGGGILGGVLLGWRTVCAVELNAFCARRLMQRQNEGHLPPFPIWDDVCSFDGRPWRGAVDVVSGGFPCQDISVAGRGAGIYGERSGLWGEMARIIRDVQPRFAFVENSPALTVRGLGRVLGDLAEMGMDARWGVLGASDVGAPHRRKRIWIVAYANGAQLRDEQGRGCWTSGEEQAKSTNHGDASVLAYAPRIDGGSGRQGRLASGGQRERERTLSDAAPNANGHRELQQEGRVKEFRKRPGDRGANACDANSTRLEERQGQPEHYGEEQSSSLGTDWWESEPLVGRVAHGVASRVDRLRAIGNGQVPAVAALAWRTLRGG